MKDYCSYAPERILWYDLTKACEIHDNDYKVKNLTYQKRLQADKKFFNNIRKSSNFLIALVYYLGVRIGGKKYETKM